MSDNFYCLPPAFTRIDLVGTPGFWLGSVGIVWRTGVVQGDADAGLAQNWPREPDANAKEAQVGKSGGWPHGREGGATEGEGRHQNPPSRWTGARSCTNSQTGPLGVSHLDLESSPESFIFI